jgi:hypothetical protein
LRALRVAPAQQLPLPAGGDDTAEQLWWNGLPEQARVEVLRLLARMIARGVLVDADADGDQPAGLS